MKTAIVGMGVIGKVHYQVLQELNADIVALCDVDSTKLSNDYVGEKFTDYEEMLKTVKPDVVHICTPHYLHADMIISALNKGINVLSEKPLCIRFEDIDRILEAEKNSTAKLGVCHQNRFIAQNMFIKDYIGERSVLDGYGTVIWNRDADYYNSGAWRGKWDTEGGGVLINQSLHTLDLLIHFIGEPSTITSVTSNITLKDVIEVEDTAFIKASGGANFTFFATNASTVDFPIKVSLLLDNERIELQDQKVIIGNTEYKFDDLKYYGKGCYGNGHKNLISAFYDAVINDKNFPVDGKEASKVIKLILSVYEQSGLKRK